MAVIWFVSLRICMNKNKLRKQLFGQGQSLSNDFIKSSRNIIQKKLIDSIIFKDAKKILLYKNVKNEININEVFAQATNSKKEIYLPKIGNKFEMSFNKFSKDQKFINNKYGIPELPNQNFINLTDLDLAVIPFVGVDALGYRLGYGGGYFDRIFNPIEKEYAPITIGLGYDYQMLSDEIREVHDMRYNMVITEENIYNFNC